MAYATPTELQESGLPAAALTHVSVPQQQRFLDQASAKMNSYLRAQYTLPLRAPYPLEVVRCCLDLACYDLLVWRGFQPDRVDENWRLRVEDQTKWLEGIAAGRVALAVTADATAVRDGRPQVFSGGNQAIGVQGGWVDGEDNSGLRGW